MSGLCAVLGGTFDPIHHGHLRAAVEAREVLRADELRLMPCALPPHRPQPGANADQRVQMITAAIHGFSGLRCDDRELKRSGPSYTYDTLIDLRAELGARPLALVLGADAFAGLPSWHRWSELSGMAHLVVLTRPDAHALLDPRLEALLAQAGTADPEALQRRPSGLVLRLEIPAMPISSTLIRQRLRAGRSVRYLLPDAVTELIHQWSLYGYAAVSG